MPAFEDSSHVWSGLRDAMDAARVAVARVRSTPVHTRDELEQLQRDAVSGQLGPDMQRLAEKVEQRQTTWDEVFDGTSPYASLLDEHFARMVNEHSVAIREALDDDPDFDPSSKGFND